MTFSFSESITIGDDPVTSQTCCSSGQITSPNLYGDSITNTGGTAGDLAGTLSITGVPTVTSNGLEQLELANGRSNFLYSTDERPPLSYLNRWIVGGLSWILSTILFEHSGSKFHQRNCHL